MRWVPAQPGRPVLEVEDLRHVDDSGVERLKGVSLNVRAGEILGIAGVSGNGQSELLEVLGGYAGATGTVRVNGQEIPLSGPGSDGRARRHERVAASLDGKCSREQWLKCNVTAPPERVVAAVRSAAAEVARGS